MLYELLREQLTRHEGKRKYPYRCTAKKDTIAIGWNLTDNGLPDDIVLMLLKKHGLEDDIIAMLFERSISSAIQTCEKLFKTWATIPDAKQVVLANMAFQLGYTRLSGFKKMIAAVEIEDWTESAHQGLDSRWANQTPGRANELMAIMRNNP